MLIRFFNFFSNYKKEENQAEIMIQFGINLI